MSEQQSKKGYDEVRGYGRMRKRLWSERTLSKFKILEKDLGNVRLK